MIGLDLLGFLIFFDVFVFAFGGVSFGGFDVLGLVVLDEELGFVFEEENFVCRIKH